MTTRAMYERTERLRADRVPFVVARVVLAERPTSAKPGDEAIVLADGTIEGFVGGQCAQATVRAQGLSVLESGTSMLLRIAPHPEPAQSGKTVVHNPCLSGGTLEIFMEPVMPPPLVRVMGNSPITSALITVGAALGYQVEEIVDLDFTGVDAVVISAHGVDEEPTLVAALRANVPYVGLIASPTRGAAVVESLDVCGSMKSRLKTPAGLDIGARTPEEIALSVFAELIERRRTPRDPSELTVLAVDIAIDPVCRMEVAAVESSIHADVDGTRWYFCCPGCKERFVANPAAFLDV